VGVEGEAGVEAEPRAVRKAATGLLHSLRPRLRRRLRLMTDSSTTTRPMIL
jgi:hypothetical protein